MITAHFLSSELLGYLAATLTTVSFVPQVWQTWRTRDVTGISLPMYIVFAVGVALWLAYGMLLAAWPIVAANAITLSLASAILVMRVRWRHRAGAAARAEARAAS